MPEFFFQRYVNGERMADDVLVTKQATLEDAIPAALRLCRNSPKSVLVYIPKTPWRDIESAPRDGTSIEVWDESPGAVNPSVVFGKMAFGFTPTICLRTLLLMARFLLIGGSVRSRRANAPHPGPTKG